MAYPTDAPRAPVFTPRPPPSGRYPHSQFMQLRCGGCRNLFEAETPTRCDISVFAMALTEVSCPNCGGTRILVGQGRTREEDAAYPWGETLDERIAAWVDNGERGSSSDAIMQRMTGAAQSKRSTPSDLQDLDRCLLLLARVPEWWDRMGEMAGVSPAWERLAAVWGRLVDTYREEAGARMDRGPAPLTREILDTANAG